MIKKFIALLTAGILFFGATSAQAASTMPPEGVPWSIDNDAPRPPADSVPPEGVPRSIDDDDSTVDEPFTRPTPPPEPVTPPPEPEPQPPQPPIDDGVEGLEFLVYHQDGVMAFAVIADHEKYRLQPVLANGHVPGRATISQMNSPDAIATINASYFDPDGTIYGNTKIDGMTAGTTYYIRSAIGIMEDGSTIFARQTYRGALNFGGKEVVISGVNCVRNADTVIVYNAWNGYSTGTNKHGVELVVQDGRVIDINRNGNSHIPPDGFVVSANGAAMENFSDVQIGDAMTFDEDYINVEYTGDFNAAVHVIGAGPTLVKSGNIYVTADAEQFPDDIRVGRAPRSAVGITKYGDYIFAVVDGRQAHSKGCTLTEWARILKNNFGAVEAINLDGGGSTELFFKGSLVNSPSDGKERPVGDALMILRK